MMQACENCRFVAYWTLPEIWRCRRYPPQLIVVPQPWEQANRIDSETPKVSPAHWCGEWQAKP